MRYTIRDTYIKAEPGESPNDRNDRAIRVAAQWYQQHLGGKVPVVLITDDKASLAKAVAGGTKAMRVREYVASLGSVELMDLVVSAGDGEEGEGGEGGAGGEGDKVAREEENRGLRTNLSRSKRKRIYSDGKLEAELLQLYCRQPLHSPDVSQIPSHQHKPMSAITAGLQRELYHQGKLRVSRYKCFHSSSQRCPFPCLLPSCSCPLLFPPAQAHVSNYSGVAAGAVIRASCVQVAKSASTPHLNAVLFPVFYPDFPAHCSITQHKPMSVITAGLQRGLYHQGKLRVSRYNCFEAFVGSESLGDEILVIGRCDMNRAVDGDVVAVELLPREQWKEPTSGALREREDDHDDAAGELGGWDGIASLFWVDGDVVAVELLPWEQWKEPTSGALRKREDDQAEEQGEEESVGLPPASADDAPSTLSSAAAALSLDKGGDGKGEGGGGGGGKEGGGGDERKGPSELARPTGRVVGVIKRNWRTYAGSLAPMRTPPASGGALVRALFVAADRRVPRIRVETRQAAQLMGKRILVAIDSWQPDSAFPSGHYVKTLGDIGDRETESEPDSAFPSGHYVKTLGGIGDMETESEVRQGYLK
ncbi:unnamed protein product [Closterium sp. NIES-53]